MAFVFPRQDPCLTKVEKWTQGPSEEEWQRHRSKITRLYQTENKTLNAVRSTMKSEYGFNATVQMYKRKIKRWDLHKNHKEDEVLEIVRQKTQRAAIGKQSKFILRKQVVSMEDIDRYLKRKHITPERLHEVLLQSYPSGKNVQQIFDLVCRTPSPIPTVANPGSIMDQTERFYVAFSHYLLSSVESDAWKMVGVELIPKHVSVQQDEVNAFVRNLSDGCIQLTYGESKLAMLRWRMAIARLESIIGVNCYEVVKILIREVSNLVSASKHVTRMLLRHLGSLLMTNADLKNGQKQVLKQLSCLEVDNLPQIDLSIRKYVCSVVEKYFLHHEEFVLYEQVKLAKRQEEYLDFWPADEILIARVISFLCSCREWNDSTMEMAENMRDLLVDIEEYERSVQLTKLIMARTKECDVNENFPVELAHTHYKLAQCQKNLGKYTEARDSLLVAMEIFENSSPAYRLAHILLLIIPLQDLIELELKMGLHDEAEQHKSKLIIYQHQMEQDSIRTLNDMGVVEAQESP